MTDAKIREIMYGLRRTTKINNLDKKFDSGYHFIDGKYYIICPYYAIRFSEKIPKIKESKSEFPLFLKDVFKMFKEEHIKYSELKSNILYCAEFYGCGKSIYDIEREIRNHKKYCKENGIKYNFTYIFTKDAFMNRRKSINGDFLLNVAKMVSTHGSSFDLWYIPEEFNDKLTPYYMTNSWYADDVTIDAIIYPMFV